MQELQEIAETEKLSYQSKTDKVFENVKWEFADVSIVFISFLNSLCFNYTYVQFVWEIFEHH